VLVQNWALDGSTLHVRSSVISFIMQCACWSGNAVRVPSLQACRVAGPVADCVMLGLRAECKVWQ
jgi:hypothetical protein